MVQGASELATGVGGHERREPQGEVGHAPGGDRGADDRELWPVATSDRKRPSPEREQEGEQELDRGLLPVALDDAHRRQRAEAADADRDRGPGPPPQPRGQREQGEPDDHREHLQLGGQVRRGQSAQQRLPVGVVIGDARQHRIDREDGHGDSSRLTNGQETDPSVHGDGKYSPPAPAAGALEGQHTRA